MISYLNLTGKDKSSCLRLSAVSKRYRAGIGGRWGGGGGRRRRQRRNWYAKRPEVSSSWVILIKVTNVIIGPTFAAGSLNARAQPCRRSCLRIVPACFKNEYLWCLLTSRCLMFYVWRLQFCYLCIMPIWWSTKRKVNFLLVLQWKIFAIVKIFWIVRFIYSSKECCSHNFEICQIVLLVNNVEPVSSRWRNYNHTSAFCGIFTPWLIEISFNSFFIKNNSLCTMSKSKVLLN